MDEYATPQVNDVHHLFFLIHKNVPDNPSSLLLSKSSFHKSDKGIDAFAIVCRGNINNVFPEGIPGQEEHFIHTEYSSYEIYLYKSQDAADGVLENVFGRISPQFSTSDVFYGQPFTSDEKGAFIELNFFSPDGKTYILQLDTPTVMGI